MNYTKYIAILSLLLIASCTTELLEQPTLKNDRNGMIKLVSRVIPFSDCDVATRANKNNDEVFISSIDYFIFDNDDVCRFHEHVTTTDPLSIDRASDELKDLESCYIVSIANTPAFNPTKGVTKYNNIIEQSFSVTGVSIPQNVGLIMIGRTEVEDLSALSSGEILTIPMESLFSKIVVNITVDSKEILPGEDSPVPTFSLTDCTVHNLATKVDFTSGTESDEGLINGDNDNTPVHTDSFSVDAYGETIDGGKGLTFSFYLPERFLHAGTAAKSFLYPFGKEEDVVIREEDKRYRQHYKPLLAKGYKAYNSTESENGDQKATYATIKGVYSDHQGHTYQVSYDIYVGNDNYSNFDIVRNTQYNNNITIKGIDNSKDQSVNIASVAIDHRVNVERIAPLIINLRRETQLDSHYEVRPLRIRKSPKANDAGISHALVEIEYLHGEDGSVANPYWIGLEHKSNNNNNSTAHLSSGKRKYFTTDLVTSTLAGKNADFSDTKGHQVVVPVSSADECVWVYVDECQLAGDNVRDAIIRITCGELNGSTFTPNSTYAPVEYRLNQRYLFEVKYNNISYLIEYEEEYLHNFDSDDSYLQTDDNGMAWGLDGVQLSHQHRAYFANGTFAGIMNWLLGLDMDVAPYYDFYLTRDTDESDAIRRDNAGQAFTSEIVAYKPNEFTPITLSDKPGSAIEYCYNRNKRNSEGIISKIEWYMPSIDEIENIMQGEYLLNGEIHKAYLRFIDFQGKPYWSSQPAFLRGRGYYHSALLVSDYADYYFDDVTSARATKITYNETYDNMSSGVDGYDQFMDIYKPLSNMTNKPVIHDITSDNQTINCQGDRKVTISKKTDKTNHPGNMLRESKARVRCVYKKAVSN